MSIEPYYMLKMQACEARTRKEIEASQITHPVDLYKPGSPHLEHLYQQLADARRFWPVTDFRLNV